MMILAQLAVVKSKKEQDTYLTELTRNNIEYAWIGVRRLRPGQNEFVTVSNQKLEDVGYVYWTNKFINPEPYNAGGNEDCVNFNIPDGGMNDIRCSNEYPFFCKIEGMSDNTLWEKIQITQANK